MKRKIAVLTQPLHDNYGGLLQAYALSKILSRYGEVTIVNRWRGHDSFIKKCAYKIRQSLIRNPLIPTKKQKEIISQNTKGFQVKYLPNLSDKITTNSKMLKLIEMGFDSYVVGSDQCWRPRYSPQLSNFFLDFINEKQNIKRIAYAASFGASEWEFTEEQTTICRELVQKFDAVSVRENSGIKLCEENLNIEALHVLDPTMLLNVDDYKNITQLEKIERSNGHLKVYVLDESNEKKNVIDYVSKKLDLQTFEVLPKKRLRSEKITNQNITEFIYPSPAEWLRGFQDAEFVITDSFHGTVFSILYKLPFIAIGNTSRGLSRFESLLQMFGLEERLLLDYNIEKANEILNSQINWNEVNRKLELERVKSIKFINNQFI